MEEVSAPERVVHELDRTIDMLTSQLAMVTAQRDALVRVIPAKKTKTVSKFVHPLRKAG